jgi:glycosyltransferase involved in cell wall biosynthesis
MTKPSLEKRALLLAAHLPDGGINTHMLTLGSELTKLGWEVAICSGAPLVDGATSDASPRTARGGFPPVAEHYERAGIRHFDVSIPERPHGLRDLPQLIRLPVAMSQVMHAVRSFRPDVLHSHTRQMGLYARVVRSLLGLPFVSTVHNPVHARNRLFARTTFLGDMAVAVSSEIRDVLIREYGIEAARVRVVFPGADAEHFRPPSPEERRSAREHHGIRPGQFVLAFIGSLTPRKRPETLIEAMADLAGTEYDVVALVAGRGSIEEALREQASSLAVSSRVRFLGHDDPRGVLWAADALVLPSESEGSPLVVVEAMLSGVPVLCTPAGGALQQITPDVSGVIFAHGDHEGLARRVVDLIERPGFGESMAARALDDARERFSSMHMARTIEGIYVDVVQRRT